MSTEGLHEQAAGNLRQHLAENAYPGRGLILGRADANSWMIVYWIMGRSEHSRNRRLVWESGQLRTEAADPSKVQDPSLIIYRALCPVPQGWVVSNGSQTETLASGLKERQSFEEALLSERHEPDAPNYTPRISGLLDLKHPQVRFRFSLIRKLGWEDQPEHRSFAFPELPPGLGLGLTTYDHDGSPLPSFSRNPLLFPLGKNPREVARQYWEALDTENRIALAAVSIEVGKPPNLTLLNRFEASENA